MEDSADSIKSEILKLSKKFAALKYKNAEFVPGKSSVSVSGRVCDGAELENLFEASMDMWLTEGRFAARFERELCTWLGVKHAALVNSGSSANLLALSLLTAEELGERRLKSGDEVITAAAGFPTTVNPIIQNGCVPVFVDSTLPTYNIDVSKIEAAVSSKTKAIIAAHTLGNPLEMDEILRIARKYNLWVIEDNCDALGSVYKGKKTTTMGHLSTVSFYPAHHITMGEGGVVLTNDDLLAKLAESFRDWGRDCWCKPGVSNTCGKRFEWTLGELPCGYDHKYTYSHIGYNLKLSDMQAAVGLAQMKKLEGFIETRKRNFKYLRGKLSRYEKHLILPEATAGSDPSWFGFPISVREGAPVSRNEMVTRLEEKKVATRLVFAGNLTRQPAYKDVKYRIHGDLTVADFIMNQSFWVGVYPALTSAHLDYVADCISEILTA